MITIEGGRITDYLQVDFIEDKIWIVGVNGEKVTYVNPSIEDMQKFAHIILDRYPTEVEKSLNTLVTELDLAVKELKRIRTRLEEEANG